MFKAHVWAVLLNEHPDRAEIVLRILLFCFVIEITDASKRQMSVLGDVSLN